MQVIKLNIVMSYPVRWTKYNIINNYVQNFYDALRIKNFISGFHYKLENNILTMSADRGFSKEWLLYIGASTKSNKRQAGGFGEGFKIASLVAYRNFNLSIKMESQDWVLQVTEILDTIDGAEKKFLAYKIEERPYQENSILYLENTTEDLLKEVVKQVNYFYFEENERFGECIVNTEDYAIYKAKKYESNKKVFGAVFASYQYRKTLRVPIVICNHLYHPKEDDRDRSELSNRQVKDCIEPVIDTLDSNQAVQVLELLKMRWSKKTEKGIEPYDWKRVISKSINIIASDSIEKKRFVKKYVDKLVTSVLPFYVSDNNKKIALIWYRHSKCKQERRIVRPEFQNLGIESIYDLCLKNNGFILEEKPNEKEMQYIQVLEKGAKELFSDIISLDDFPECRILLNEEAPCVGFTKVVKYHDDKRNIYGLKVMRYAKYVCIKRNVLCIDAFEKAFTTYIHELLHQFGGDSSIQFRKALLLMNKKLMKNSKILDSLEKDWRKISEIT